jgi:hypothetical protein
MNDETVHIFLGHDKREAAAYHVCQQSILDTALDPDRICFHAVTGAQRDGSNAFTYARFLIPYRMRWGSVEKHAIWLDGDMVVREPIEELWALRRHDVALQVVKHEYQTQHPRKYVGTPMESDNRDYPAKNQSSVMVVNCGTLHNRVLTPDFVARHDGSFLHRFGWLTPQLVGALPERWNFLVNEMVPSSDVALGHFTIGVPGFSHYADDFLSDEWHAAYSKMVNLEGERPLDVAVRAERARRIKERGA